MRKVLLASAMTLALGACTAATPPSKNMNLIDGPPPVQDVETVYDKALACVQNEMQDVNTVTLAVGNIEDATGKFSNEGNGYYITQAAGDILQSSFHTAQPGNIVNRRDTAVMQLEMNVGRQLQWQGSAAHATGSINTLDFVPGGGVEVSVAGVGAKARQYRMVVGMDIFLTDTMSSKILAKTSLHKQIVAYDYGASVGRFFGSTLVTMNIGEQQREAVGFATRNMLKLAAFELLSDLYNNPFSDCRQIIDDVEGVIDSEDAAALERAAEQERTNRFLDGRNSR